MTLQFVLTGARAGEAAQRLSAVLGSDGTAVTQQSPETADEATRRAIDLIALTSLIVAIPGAVLAVIDLADRIAKRRKAQRILTEVRQIRAELDVDTLLIRHDGTTASLVGLDADQLLDAASSGDAGDR